jgi:molybdopterin converting factor small subunit
VRITVELTCDMSQALGTRRVEVEGAVTAADVVRLTRARFGERAAEFERLTGVAAVAVNGVRVTHGRGLRTKVADGDRVMFVKASAGG